MRQSDGQQYVGRIQGSGSTCGTAGRTDAFHIQHDQKGLSLDEFKADGFNGKFYTFPYFVTFLLKKWLKEKN